jgi:hypothetical protein
MNQQLIKIQIKVNKTTITIYNDYIIESRVHPFLSKKIPAISIINYLNRIVKYTSIENSTLEIMLILIDRFCEQTKIILNYFNIHK